MIGYCFYLDSPDARLLISHRLLKRLQLYRNLLIYSLKTKEQRRLLKLIDELTDKLAYKDYLNAKLYFNLGNYMGNNYESAMITAQNSLRKYPFILSRRACFDCSGVEISTGRSECRRKRKWIVTAIQLMSIITS